MNVVFDLTIPTLPVAQPRHKHARITTKTGKTIDKNYIEKEHPVLAYKAALALYVASHRPGQPPLQGPLIVSMHFYLPRPNYLMKKSSPPGPVPHTSRPDLDNLIKATKDALKGILWKDDSQVFLYGPGTGKHYAEKDREARVEIKLWTP